MNVTTSKETNLNGKQILPQNENLKGKLAVKNNRHVPSVSILGKEGSKGKSFVEAFFR